MEWRSIGVLQAYLQARCWNCPAARQVARSLAHGPRSVGLASEARLTVLLAGGEFLEFAA